ncbi:hypothetical protein HMPREF1870_00596 [Bacteroidales bacterium KA00344]|nr:hypothetical protein HMPREF1870_00596 [Bacteroidales bacterium KA00344]
MISTHRSCRYILLSHKISETPTFTMAALTIKKKKGVSLYVHKMPY